MSRVLLKHLSSNFQGLPRLPVPELGLTLERYRRSVKHLKKSEKIERHFQSVANFESTIAPKLQAQLLKTEEANSVGGYPFSYIERVWDDGYLGFRGPSPVNISPSVSLKGVIGDSQASVATKMAIGIFKWIKQASSEGIIVDAGGDISQMEHQFCCSRVPGENRDSITHGDFREAKHVTVLAEGLAYLLRMVDDEGKLYSHDTIKHSFERILSMKMNAEHPSAVSVLTSASRNDWSASYAELVRNVENSETLKKIQHSAVVICLDSQEWLSGVETQEAMLCGGSQCENRWYDKHQIIVSKNAHVAFNFEHAFSDGMIWCKWIAEVLDIIKNDSSVGVQCPPTCDCAAALVEQVNISFGKSFASRIRNAKQDLKKLVGNVDLASAIIPVGKNKLKELGFSPDAFAQMCFQHAFFKSRGKIAPTYESCSTNKFFHGRTETIRAATSDMLALFLALENGSSDAECRQLMFNAAKTHIHLAKEASNAQGVDRHLLALQKIAETLPDKSASDFFKEEVYTFSNTWLLSTSNISQPFLEYFNFGPVTSDGYGIGYVVDEECIRASVSAWKESSLTEATELKTCIEISGERLLTLLSKV